MIYLLDTDTCIRYINGRSPKIRAKLPTLLRLDVGVSIITKAELYYGSAKSQTPERSRQKQLEFLQTIQIVPFDEAAAVVYGIFAPIWTSREHPLAAMTCDRSDGAGE
jgi:tRNA(fMet)-specific endonuclease VapC